MQASAPIRSIESGRAVDGEDPGMVSSPVLDCLVRISRGNNSCVYEAKLT